MSIVVEYIPFWPKKSLRIVHCFGLEGTNDTTYIFTRAVDKLLGYHIAGKYRQKISTRINFKEFGVKVAHQLCTFAEVGKAMQILTKIKSKWKERCEKFVQSAAARYEHHAARTNRPRCVIPENDDPKKYVLQSQTPSGGGWPDELGVKYSNALHTIHGNKEYTWDFEPVHGAIQVRPVPSGHPCAGAEEVRDNQNYGVFATERIPKGTVLLHYAGHYYPAREEPYNDYIMEMAPDFCCNAYGVGNEGRFFNDYHNIVNAPNTIVEKPGGLRGAPEWIQSRPFVTARDIEAGEELVIDYGKGYWQAVSSWKASLSRALWMNGDQVEFEMDGVLEGLSVEERISYAGSVYGAAYRRSLSKDRALVSFDGRQLEVRADCIHRARLWDADDTTRFAPGDAVEYEAAVGTCQEPTACGWWPARIEAIQDKKNYIVYCEASDKNFVAPIHTVRSPITHIAPPFEPTLNVVAKCNGANVKLIVPYDASVLDLKEAFLKAVNDPYYWQRRDLVYIKWSGAMLPDGLPLSSSGLENGDFVKICIYKPPDRTNSGRTRKRKRN